MNLRRPGVRGREVGALGGGLAACVGASLALAACANILGLQDRTEDNDGSTGGTTSSSASTVGTGSSSSSTGSTGPKIEDAGPDGREKGGGGDGSLDDGADVEVPEASAACPATGPCVIASGVNHPWTIAADEQRVYWTEWGSDNTTSDGTVKSCPVTGCGNGGPTIYASNIFLPRDIVIDSTSVYWATQSAATPGGIWKCPLTGCVGAATQIATAAEPYGMGVDATYVYWVDQVDSSVHRAPKAGGGTNQVLNDGGSGLYATPERAAVDNAFVYFTDNSGAVVSVPFDGGTARVIETNDSVDDYPIVVDSTSIYYGATNISLSANYPNSDFFFRADKKTNNPTQVPLVPNVGWAYALALDSDAGQLYFGDFGFDSPGAVGKVGIDGGGLVYFGQNLSPVEWVAVNSTYLFYATYADDTNLNANTGTIVRIGK